ncbi:FeoA family protein [Hydrogenimonas urashimensis]|uniref:FeoA family protein n=1 Tax=Hydrogenimonas urashimensis TaxID=2740515 RepID=UPI00191617ED|nr:FeoA family protein [Hydrogenimonas urashimensis]
MRLSEAKTGDLVKIRGFEGGCDTFKSRLDALGIRIGDIVEIKSKAFLGPIEIKNENIDVALCRGQAEKIIVKPITPIKFRRTS